MKLILWCNAFPKLVIEEIDLATFPYYGSTDGYDHRASESTGSITFRLKNSDQSQELVDKIKSTFQLNQDYVKPEDYIKLRDTFQDYETDRRPVISIKIRNGSRGLINPPQFSFSE